jgi:hypothetical protein
MLFAPLNVGVFALDVRPGGRGRQWKSRPRIGVTGDVQDLGGELLLVVGKIMVGTIVVLFIPHLPHSSAKVEAPDYPITHDP